MVKNCGQKIASFLKVGRKHLNSNKNDLKWRMNLCFRSFCGRSGEAQTRGLRIPNAARYQLRYTPIVIKLWSCKWSNLWSKVFCRTWRRRKSEETREKWRFCELSTVGSRGGHTLPNHARYQLRYTPIHNISIIPHPPRNVKNFP